MVVFEKCTDQNSPGIRCKTDAEMKNFLVTKYIVVLENRKDFI